MIHKKTISEPGQAEAEVNPLPEVYGQGDASFRAAGGEEGIAQLVRDFYNEMSNNPVAKTIRDMHPDDLEVSIDKLSRFLCGWLGGPKRFSEKYGKIQIPVAHRHLAIGEAERDSWLMCMEKAVALQPFEDDFKRYLLRQLAVPAERCRNR